MNTVIPVITLDGPSGTGKSSISKALAKNLGWHRLESGILYRLLALYVYEDGVDISDRAQLRKIVSRLTPEFTDQLMLSGDTDLNEKLRREEIGILASKIAPDPEVRRQLATIQRIYCRAPGLVAEGRDLGTVIFADAVLKIFLDASIEERTRRRYQQLKDQSINVKIGGLAEDMVNRDRRDTTRTVSPLAKASDALLIDTTTMDIAMVTQEIMHLWKHRQ